MVKGNKNHDPGLKLELEQLRRLDRELAAKVDRKMGGAHPSGPGSCQSQPVGLAEGGRVEETTR
jgi:hypothetical protein